MRAHEFADQAPANYKFADGQLVFSKHFKERLEQRGVPMDAVLRFLKKLEQTRSIDLIRMPYVSFVVKSPDLALAFYKSKDKDNKTIYTASTIRPEDLRSGEDQDVIYLEEATGEDVLKYVKGIHHDFHIDDTILTHPRWSLTRVPLSKLHIPDPESGEDLDDPYNRVQMIDMYHVDDITRHDIERKPIVVDTDGHIIDGNHRALAARLGGMTDIPAWIPVAVNENFVDGKVKGKSRPGRVKRAGASCKGSVTDLRAKARKYGGERGKMYHWCANMKGGKKK